MEADGTGQEGAGAHMEVGDGAPKEGGAGRSNLGCALRLTLSPLAHQESAPSPAAGRTATRSSRAPTGWRGTTAHTEGKEVQLPHLRQALHAQRPP